MIIQKEILGRWLVSKLRAPVFRRSRLLVPRSNLSLTTTTTLSFLISPAAMIQRRDSGPCHCFAMRHRRHPLFSMSDTYSQGCLPEPLESPADLTRCCISSWMLLSARNCKDSVSLGERRTG